MPLCLDLTVVNGDRGCFSGENMNIRNLVWALPLLALPGCQSSDRTLNLQNIDLVLGEPIKVQPPGTLATVFSPDGRYYAASVFGKESWTLEVRSYDGKTLYRGSPISGVGLAPVLFVKDGAGLVYMDNVSEELKLLDWKTSRVVTLRVNHSKNSHPTGTNPQQSMALIGSSLVLPTGETWPIPQDAKFSGWASPDGAVFLQGNQWTLVRPNGTVRSMSARPAVLETSDRRGPLSLHIQTDTIKHKEGKAYATSLWLEHSGAVKSKSAIVGLEYSPIVNFWFVPGHDAVTYFTPSGSVVVPFTYQKPEKRRR